jgi:hypothetical protein
VQRSELRDVGLGRGLIGEAPLIGEFALAETTQRGDLVRVVLPVIPARPEAMATATAWTRLHAFEASSRAPSQRSTTSSA